ncbi:MAG: MFS transporter [Firmicutes bacterium]|nr:MFS transporter [Bacillota bacterium]
MEQRLSMKSCLGYSLTGITQAGVYNLMTGYMLLFMTSVVGMKTELAGMIVSVGMIMEMISGLIVGKMSDSCTSPKGRRRPFIIASIILILPSMMITFSRIGGENSGNMVVPYLAICTVFWIAHSILYVPFISWGAEIATDYDDRTRLRSMTSFFNVIGTLLGSSCPLMIVSFLQKNGAAESKAWFMMASFVAISCSIFLVISMIMTRGQEHMPEDGHFSPMTALKEIPLMIKDFWQLLQLKTMRILLLFKACFNTAFGLYTSAMVFFLQYRMGYGNEVTSTVYTVQTVVNLATVFVMSWLGIKLGKTVTILLSMIIAGVGCIVFYIVGIHSYASLMVFIVMFAIAVSCFWQLSGAIFYDVTEVDEFTFGKRREGAITSLQSAVGSLVGAIVASAFSAYLAMNGFDATLAAQPESAIAALDRIFLLTPGVAFLLACAILAMYPLNKKRFMSLQSALRLKQQGRDYSQYQEDLDKIL